MDLAPSNRPEERLSSQRPEPRVIARLDLKGPNLIKGVQMEGLRIIGDPALYARKYYSQGVDEILFIDTVASLYGRQHMSEILEETVRETYVPVTVGGGISSVEDVRLLLRAGADKVAINTAAVRNPKLITGIAESFGSQCVVGSIQAKKIGDEKWEVLIEGGRERTGLDVLQWAEDLLELGVGEILVTSVDRDGTGAGFDKSLAQKVRQIVDVPLIVSGGCSGPGDVLELCLHDDLVDGIAVGYGLHYEKFTVGDLSSQIEECSKPERVEPL